MIYNVVLVSGVQQSDKLILKVNVFSCSCVFASLIFRPAGPLKKGNNFSLWWHREPDVGTGTQAESVSGGCVLETET